MMTKVEEAIRCAMPDRVEEEWMDEARVVAVTAPGVHEVRIQLVLVIGVRNPPVSPELFNRALRGHWKLQKNQALSIGNASFMMYARAFSQCQGSAKCVIDLSRDDLNASMRRTLAPKAAG